MKITPSSSGTTISGSVGGQKGSVGVGNNGAVNLGLDFGGVKLGVTNDYGGAGTIGFGGQSITWGLEGGKLEFGIGGFDVKVEARNCVVVETKRIAGMIVASRTYPDPGCKEKTPERAPKPPPFDPAKGLDLEEGADMVYVVAGYEAQSFYATWSPGYGFFPASNWSDSNSMSVKFTISNIPENVSDPRVTSFAFGIPFSANAVLKGFRSYVNRLSLWDFSHEVESSYELKSKVLLPWSRYSVWVASPLEFVPPPKSICKVNGELAPNSCSAVNVPYSSYYIVFGSRTNCKAFLKNVKNSYTSAQDKNISSGTLIEGSTTSFSHRFIISHIIPVGNKLPSLPLSQGGNRPPMPESCCESLKADIEDIKQVLATKEMLAKKLTFPWRLRMPGGQGDEVITDYPNLARCIAQMIDHLGIHPPKLSIKDINNAIAGDQGISNQFPSATQGFEALMAQVWDANADVDTLTNFLYRLSWLCVQQSMNLAVVSSDIQCIKDMVGGATKPNESSIVTPFNIGAGVKEASTKGKGFGKSSEGAINKKIDANTELATESLLPDFLKVRDNPIVIESFDGDKDIFDMLSMLLLKIETLLAR